MANASGKPEALRALQQPSSRKSLGECCLCGREMLSGKAVDRHHPVPKSQGGKDWVWMHRICHRKLHSMWSEKQLARDPVLNNPQIMAEHPQLESFIAWVRKQPLDFYAPSLRSKSKG